ncbi:GNAT family N-acetyltransferase [Candidatus Gracilibacteria bacterium]|nr:GNAT family N-acetyltransferase [Candidatus Gracilibacteria bacterium]
MRVLLDTNILIETEGLVSPSGTLQKMFSTAEENNINFSTSGKSIDEISRHRDPKERQITLDKVGKYPVLVFNLAVSENFRNLIYPHTSPITDRRPNHDVDDHMLFCVYKNAVHYLVTGDKGIHTKATRAGLQDRVFYIQEFLEFLEDKFVFTGVAADNQIEKLPLCEIEIKDPIFDSLREDYDGFEYWFNDKARQGRDAWVIKNRDGILGICIYDPNNIDCENKMKLCTFKVGDDSRGNKIGELLLRQAICFAYKNKISDLWVEVFKDKENIIAWLESFGFGIISEKSRNGRKELKLKKVISPPRGVCTRKNVLRKSIEHYPYWVKPPLTRVFLVPIQPGFVRNLFPDIDSNSTQLSLNLPIENMPCGNAIRKAYVCKSATRQARPGDLLLFYESGGRSDIVGLGMVEKTSVENQTENIISLIGKRSVYPKNEIDEKFDGRMSLVILFRYLFPIKPISLKQLGYLDLSAPQSITNVTNHYATLEPLLLQDDISIN